ncbi:MAG: DUF2851 family protein [Deltaproteobacteria bacterium]|nr:DUF2851 family protein [Deltaproteobacteria bacterium]
MDQKLYHLVDCLDDSIPSHLGTDFYSLKSDFFMKSYPLIPELWLHFLWNADLITKNANQFVNREDTTILFKGWYNSSWGPDFSEAKITTGPNELFGSVEIHINESDWFNHKHHLDDHYNNVILHVFLNPSKNPAINTLGEIINRYQIDSDQLESVLIHPQGNLKKLKDTVPGKCGIILINTENNHFERLIQQAAELRLIQKAKAFKALFLNDNYKIWESELYQSICRSLGYASYANIFEHLAKKLNYYQVLKFYDLSIRQRRIEVFSRWFGYLGLIDRFAIDQILDESRREWFGLQQTWQSLNQKVFSDEFQIKKPSRPLNHPVRRLTGLFYHIEQIKFNGIFKSWLSFLRQCQKTIDNSIEPVVSIQKQLNLLFPQPEWEPLSHVFTLHQAKKTKYKNKLIGRNRQLIILVNSILPYFLAWARRNQDIDLEKTLFKLFMLLPTEGSNHKTKFMEFRFNSKCSGKLKRRLFYHQGLIQIHDDFCKSFYEGCNNCSFLNMLKK